MQEDGSLETTVLLISLAIIPVLLALLVLCLKIKTSKSNPDLFGLEGTVKSKETDEAHLTNGCQDKLNVSAGDERAEVKTPSYDRKLPELPNDAQFKGREDSNSELYATVDEVPTTNNNCIRMVNLSQRPNINIVPESSHHPYAQVKKQRRQEHPYASVGEIAGRENQADEEEDDEDDIEQYETAEHLIDSNRSEAVRDSGRGRGATSWVSPRRGPEENRGRGSSRQTTPLPPEPPPEQHFSGDSQDSFSAKGYTSISVREPLANLSRQAPPMEGNYVTLSETSDEMYAAIEDTVYTHPGGANKEGASGGSDMYSKVDKAKKRGRSVGPEDGATYSTVSKGASSLGADHLGARPKQRSPMPPSALSDSVDYSEYEVAHSDSRSGGGGKHHSYEMNRSYHESYSSTRDPGYETVPYADNEPPGFSIAAQGLKKLSGSRDPGYETLVSDRQDLAYEERTRDRVNSIDPGYETVPQTRPDPGYASVIDRGESLRHDPGYETVIGGGGSASEKRRSNHHATFGPRSFPPDDYESVQPREPGYETLPEVLRDDQYHSLEPGYETLPEVRRESGDVEVQYSRVNKKGPRMMHPQLSQPRPRLYSGSEVNYETLAEPRRSHRVESDEAGYETIPDSQQDRQGHHQYDPGYETLPPVRLPPSEPGYETIPGARGDPEDIASEAATTDPDYARLKDADIEFIDESGDEVDDELGRLQGDEDVTVESSQGSSLIHMSVVESGTGVRRSSVVVIEHVDMTPVPSRASDGVSETDVDINTHIFV